MTVPNYIYDLLEGTGYRWNFNQGPAGTGPTTITYSFLGNTTDQSSGNTIAAMTAQQQATVQLALNYIEQFCNVTFQETNSSGADITFGFDMTANGSNGEAGITEWHLESTGGPFFLTNSTVYLDNVISNSDLTPGGLTAAELQTPDAGYGWITLLHELGHALGLKHPFDENAANDPASVLDTTNPSQDNRLYSLMSYTDASQTAYASQIGGGNNYNIYDLEPANYGMFDIAALQYLYGPSAASSLTALQAVYDNNGDTVTGAPGAFTYTFTPNTAIFETISDGGTNDTLNVASFTQACTINLTPGSFSTLGITVPVAPAGLTFPAGYTPYDGTNALAIALGTSVTTCIGGGGNDIITGGSANDTLIGGAGNNTLIGGRGINTVAYVNTPQSVIVSLATGQATNNGYGDTDTLTNIQDITTIGNGDTLSGGAAACALSATGNSNTLVGGSGQASFTVAGNGNSVTDIAGTGIVSIAAMNDSVALSSGSLTVGADSALAFQGSDNAITAQASDQLAIAGYTNTILAVSGGDGLNVSGVGNVLAESSGNLTVGAGSGLAFQGSSNAVIADADAEVAIGGYTNTILAVSGGDLLTVSGVGNVLAESSGTVSIVADSGLAFQGSDNTITVRANSEVAIGGYTDSILAISGGDLLTVSGVGNVLAESSGVLSIGAASGLALQGSSNAITVGAAAEVSIAGYTDSILALSGGDVLTVSGVGNALAESSGSLAVGAGSGLNFQGSSNTITVGANAEVALSGYSDSVTATAGGDVLSVSGVGSSVALAGGSLSTAAFTAVTVQGSSNTLSAVANDELLLTGSSNTVESSATGQNEFAVSGSGNTLQFGASIADAQLWFTTQGNNLDISVIGTSNDIVVENWYSGASNQFATLDTADGHTLANSAVANLVSAMAMFSLPPLGQTTLTGSEATTLDPVIAANWH